MKKMWRKIQGHQYPLLLIAAMVLFLVILVISSFIYFSKDIALPNFMPISRNVDVANVEVITDKAPINIDFDETGKAIFKSDNPYLAYKNSHNPYTEIKINTDKSTVCKMNNSETECSDNFLKDNASIRVIGLKEKNSVDALFLEIQ